MIAAHHIPRAPLSDFIKVIWYWDGYLQPHTRERLLPDGCMTIALNLGEHRTPVCEPQGELGCDVPTGQA